MRTRSPWLGLLLSLWAWYAAAACAQTPRLREGVLNLGAWNPEEAFEIRGEAWVFEGEWIDPETFEPAHVERARQVTIPDFDFASLWDAKRATRRTYVIALKQLPHRDLAVREGRIAWASRVFVWQNQKDPQLLFQGGDPGDQTGQAFVPSYETWRYGSFVPQGDEAYLLIQVASVQEQSRVMSRPAILEALELGTRAYHEHKFRTKQSFNFFIVGIFCLMVLYNLSFTFQKDKDPGHLCLVFMGLGLILRALSTSGMISTLPVSLTMLHFELTTLGLHFGQQLVATSLICFVGVEFPGYISRKSLAYAWVLLLANAFCFLLLHPQHYLISWFPFAALTLPLGFLVAWTYVRLWRAREVGALIGCISVCLLLACHIYDGIVQLRFLNWIYLGDYGWIAMLFGQTMIIARKFSEQHRKTKELTQTLLTQNQSLEAQKRALQKLSQEQELTQKALLLESEARLAMAASVAHRLNNPLHYMGAGVDQLLQTRLNLKSFFYILLGGDDPADAEMETCRIQVKSYMTQMDEALDVMTHGLERAAKSVGEIRSLSGVDGYGIERFNLQKLWEELLAHLNEQLEPQAFRRLILLQAPSVEYEGHLYLLESCLETLILRCLEGAEGTLTIALQKGLGPRDLSVLITGPFHIDEATLNALRDRFQMLLKPIVLRTQIEREHEGLNFHCSAA